MAKLIAIIEAFANWVARSTMWLLVPMFCISLFEVISRYFFNAPTTWAAPVLSILFIAVVVPAGADLAARDGHVRMDAFYSRWQGQNRALADLLGALLLLLFAGILAVEASEVAARSLGMMERTWGAFRAPVYPKKLAFAFGAALLFLEAVALVLRAGISLRKR